MRNYEKTTLVVFLFAVLLCTCEQHNPFTVETFETEILSIGESFVHGSLYVKGIIFYPTEHYPQTFGT